LQSSVETRLIHLGEQEVPYLLKRTRRRSVGLHVDANGLTVQAPIRASQKWLDTILREKAGWVIAKLTQMRASALPKLVWQDGVHLPFGQATAEIKKRAMFLAFLAVAIGAAAFEEPFQEGGVERVLGAGEGAQ